MSAARVFSLSLAIAGVFAAAVAAISLLVSEPGTGLSLSTDLGLMATAVGCLCGAVALSHVP